MRKLEQYLDDPEFRQRWYEIKQANKADLAAYMLKVDTNLPEWVQSKITLAEDYISTASNYLQGEMKEEVAHSVHVKTYDSHGEKQMNSPEFKKHIEAHGGKLDYASDKGAAFKFASHSHAAAFHKGVQSKFRELDSEHDMHEEVAVNSVGAGNVAGLQGEPPVRKKKKNVMSFNRFARK